MAVTVEEDITSRSFEVTARGATLTAKYCCFGSQDEVEVYNAVRAESPTYTTTGLTRTKIGRAEFRGGRLAYVAVEYGTGEGTPNNGGIPGDGGVPAGVIPDDNVPPASASTDANMSPNQSFSTIGGTAHITQARADVSRTRASDFTGTAPDPQKAIGLRKDGVEGCDVVTGKMKYTFTLDRRSVSLADMRNWMSLTGKINDSLWKGFKAGEMLFEGCEGQGSAFGQWTVTFHFLFSEDWPAGDPRCTIRTLLEIPAKKGWDYLWIAYQETITGDQLYPLPRDAYVQRVYDEANFGAIGIGS